MHPTLGYHCIRPLTGFHRYFAPTQTISGPHSRDYDFMFGHGALQVLLFAQGLPGMTGPVCERNDTHCERSDDEQNVFALLNLMAGNSGYAIPPDIKALASLPAREISGRFIAETVTANGNEAAWAHRCKDLGPRLTRPLLILIGWGGKSALPPAARSLWRSGWLIRSCSPASAIAPSHPTPPTAPTAPTVTHRTHRTTTCDSSIADNYVRNDVYTIGSASQDYITNTHSKYFPGPQDKLFDLELGSPGMSMLKPVPAITLVPDYLDDPYGHIHEALTNKPSHLALYSALGLEF